MDLLTFDRQNRERIQVVENAFRPMGQPLSRPGRTLMGQGRLMKQNRKKRERKAFFLFNDILVYGSIVMNGRWYNKQKIIPLEDIQLEDMEDNDRLKHQWLIRTPSKSFYVSALSNDEKRAWMEHIETCRSSLLQDGSRQPGFKFANSWIPDQAADKCMRCFCNFSRTTRRHHCRKCGFLVCNSCSKWRAVIDHIHPTKRLRICSLCHTTDKEDETARQRGGSGQSYSEEDEVAASSEEEEDMEIQTYTSSCWLDSRVGTWGQMNTYAYPRSVLQTAVVSEVLD